MNKKKKLIIVTMIMTSALALSACGGADRLVKSADETESAKLTTDETKSTDEKTYEEKVQEWEKIYSDTDKSVEETVSEIEPEKVGGKNTAAVLVKDSYTNVDELAQFTSDVLFKFYRGEFKGDDYVVFLEKYASEEAKGYLTGNHKDDVKYMNIIQSKINETGKHYVHYEVSKPVIDGDEAVFYRKLIASNGLQAFYKTQLVKVDGNWYFQNDEPTVPVAF